MNLGVEPSGEEAVHRASEMAISAAVRLLQRRPCATEESERFYSVCSDAGEVAGFFYFEEREDAIFYGLGLRPELTGRGLGGTFVNLGLEFAESRFGRRRIVLEVAEFNERAIRVYERAGFRRTGSKLRFFDGWGDVPFVDMERPAEQPD